MLHAMIMAGGGGTRFWPRSRQQRPKQFLALGGDRTLLQQAYDRLEAQVSPERIWVLTGAAYVEETARQLPHLSADRVVGEPTGRDTAACIALGAALVARTDPDATMIVTPADHVIEPVQEFRRALHVAEQTVAAHPSALVTFGIPPTFPSTGYGYVHRGAAEATRQGVPVYESREFKEKPDFETAQRFVVSGEYLWNSGIFVWKAATILRHVAERLPDVHAGVQRIADAWATPQRDAVLRKEYPTLTKTSIDFAVMQKAKEVLIVQAPYKWDDVGSWLAVERMQPQDADGNTVMGDHCGWKTNNCVIAADPGHLIATVGVKDLIVIQDGNATLVAHRDHEGEVKKIVEALRERGQDSHL